MAQEVSRVINVLSHRQRRTVYDAVRKVRDEAAAAACLACCGAEFRGSIDDLHGDLWRRCCRLFRFDIEGDEQKLGENGLKDLASEGPNWIVYEFLDARVGKVDFAELERKAGCSQRDAWHACCGCRDTSRLFFTLRRPAAAEEGNQGDPPRGFNAIDYVYQLMTCPRCGQRYQPTEFDDRYLFVLADNPWRGQVIRGEPVWGSSPAFVIVGSPGGKPSPKELLERFFELQDEGDDATLRQAEVDLLRYPPDAEEHVNASNPATSRGSPWGLIAAGVLVLGIVLRMFSNNESSHYSPSDGNPAKLNSPDWNDYPAPDPPPWPLSSRDGARMGKPFGRFHTVFRRVSQIRPPVLAECRKKPRVTGRHQEKPGSNCA